MIESALWQFLVSNPGVYALVGNRIGPMKLPRNPKFPEVTYQVISSSRPYVHEGAAGLTTKVVQYDVWAKSYQECKSVAKALREALEGYRGTMDGVTVYAVFLLSQLDDYDQETGIYRQTMDFEVSYKE